MQTEHLPRSIEQLAEEQAHRWELGRGDAGREPRRPIVTVSRQHGAGGAQLARRLAEEAGFSLFDREIIRAIAQSAHLSERVVSVLDERERAWLTDCLSALASDQYLSPADYRFHLTRVLGVVARQGGAVILGRGAHLLFGQAQALRVLVVAPLEARIGEIARREQLDERQARGRIAEVEAARRAFLMQHFHADAGDLSAFDLVVNTGVLGIEGALGAVQAALTPMLRAAPARRP